MRGFAYNTTPRVPHPFKDGGAIAHSIARGLAFPSRKISARLSPPWQGGATGGYVRPAFSLAEIMIAIGILGVGMLMVAATFPVGLDQCRIVSEQTVAPMVANDAFERLRLLLAEPDSSLRIADTTPVWRFSFRKSIERVNANGFVRSHLDNGEASAFDWVGINQWLVAPYVPGAVGPRGAGTRFYPSIPANYQSGNWMLPLRTDAAGNPALIEPPYTWSALYRKYTLPSSTQTYVQFFVFVNRRGSDWPDDWPRPASVDLSQFGAWTVNDPVPLPLVDDSATPKKYYSASSFSEGGYLVDSRGNILRIKAVDTTSNPGSPTLILDKTPATGSFYFILPDPATGRSPCIGVYSRAFPM